MLSHKWSICINARSLCKAQITCWRGKAEIKQAPEDGEESYAKLPSGLDTAFVLMNSKQLWMPTQDQDIQHSSMEQGDHETLRHTEELLMPDGLWKGNLTL